MKKTFTLFLLMLVSLAAFSQKQISAIVKQETRLTARGNSNELILKAMAQYKGSEDSVKINSVKINLEGTSEIADVKKIKVFTTGLTDCQNNKFFDEAVLIGSCDPREGDFTCELNGSLLKGINYLWLAVDLADDAVEGNFVDMSLLSIDTETEVCELKSPSPIGRREIILARTTLLRPGDYNSKNYRIPAVIIARNGDIVAVTDKRKYNNGDLPEDIDIVCNVSSDGGHTWTEPYTIIEGTGHGKGYGDCALALNNDESGIIAAFVGGPGFWGSTPANPLRMYISRSNDNGKTWEEAEDITSQIYGADCQIEGRETWLGGFFGSGSGLLTSSGRIMFVIAMRENDGTGEVICNRAVYSDDNGKSWQVSERASVGGDEAKVVELVDGRILMSIRRNGNRWYNISEDGGLTWQASTSEWTDIVAPACNGDIIRYSSVNKGGDKNRLLHSVPTGSSRKNVTVYVSYDEGETWPTSRCVVPYNSAYSSLCVLPDNTIGLYVEEAYQNEGDYCTVFYNFSLDWLTNGEDSYENVDEIFGSLSEMNLRVYPNPARNYITVEAENLKVINIYNVQGQLIYTLQNNEDVITLDISDFDNGIYFIEGIDNEFNKKQSKFIVN